MFTSGPPELPGLMAASVCTASMNEKWLVPRLVVTGRSSALMMPVMSGYEFLERLEKRHTR